MIILVRTQSYIWTAPFDTEKLTCNIRTVAHHPALIIAVCCAAFFLPPQHVGFRCGKMTKLTPNYRTSLLTNCIQYSLRWHACIQFFLELAIPSAVLEHVVCSFCCRQPFRILFVTCYLWLAAHFSFHTVFSQPAGSFWAVAAVLCIGHCWIGNRKELKFFLLFRYKHDYHGFS